MEKGRISMPDMSTFYQYPILEIEMQRDFKGIWIPKEVWLDERLSALDKIILMEIDSLDRSEDGCFAGNQSLADFCKCSERKVSDSIAKLISYGYIRIQKFDGRVRHLRSNLKADSQNLPDRVAKNARQSSKKCEADTQKVRHSNINTYLNSDNKQSKGDLNRLIDEFTDNEELRETISDFIDMRKLIKKPMTEKALKLLLNKLKEFSSNEEEQIKILNESIEHNWQSIYKPEKKKEIDMYTHDLDYDEMAEKAFRKALE